MVQIKMKETRQASPDGVSIKQYDAGQTYTGATPHEVRLLESFVFKGIRRLSRSESSRNETNKSITTQKA
jgi:hypothetical protein